MAEPEETNAAMAQGQLPQGQSAVMYRGRAAENLVARSVQHPWSQFTECPCEDLREPERVHLDPLGNVHICQGIVAGNIFSTPLGQICDQYQPDTDPVTGPLLDGGRAEVVCH